MMRYYVQYLQTYLIIQRKRWLDRLSSSRSMSYVPFVILSEPRSGSTLLHTCLNSHSQIKSYGEVLRENVEQNANAPLADDSVSRLAFRPHTRALKAIGLKIFYDYSEDPVYAAAFRDIVKRNDVRIIHLVRKDILKVYVSLQIARKTNVWSSTKTDDRTNVKITVDIDDFKRFAAVHKQRQQEFATLFQDHPLIRISYEELAENASNTLDSVQRFLGVRSEKLFSLLQKQNPDSLESLVTNYDDVLRSME